MVVITSIEGPSDTTYKVTEAGSKIGRHSTNQIIIFDESVSRHHAQIFFSPSGRCFYLKDIGSTTGTFIKITEPLELQLDMIIEIGSYQLIVSGMYIHQSVNNDEALSNSYVEFMIYESPEEIPNKTYTITSGQSIGRKQTNAISYTEDLHMSNLHCKVNLVFDRFFFEDMASTNGSWLRLSKEGLESKPVLLQNHTVFKIGNSTMYDVSFPKVELKANGDLNTIANHQEKQGPGQKCTICWDAERDCLILPCRHNVTCTKCIKN